MYVSLPAPYPSRVEAGGRGEGGDGAEVRTAGEFPGISRFNEVRRAEWPEHGVLFGQEI